VVVRFHVEKTIRAAADVGHLLKEPERKSDQRIEEDRYVKEKGDGFVEEAPFVPQNFEER